MAPKTIGAGGGRRSRVVLTPRRWRQVQRSYPLDDGGKRARSPGRARRKPLKPLRAGMPGDLGATCGDYTRVLSFCTRGCGCIERPAFPTPSVFLGRIVLAHLGRIRAAGMRRCIFPSLRAKRSNPSSSFRDGPKDQTSDAQLRIGESRDSGFDASHRPGMTASGLLRGACHRARIRATRWLAMTALDLNRFGYLKIESGITLATAPRPLLSSSCPALCRASTSCLRLSKKDVDGRDI
jgi:hypothetical protein